MLRDGVHQRVPGLLVLQEQPPDPGRPRGEVAELHEDETGQEDRQAAADEDARAENEELEGRHGDFLPPPENVADRNELEAEEHRQRADLLHGPQRRPADHGDGHRPRGADDVPERVRPVQASAVPPEPHHYGGVEAHQVVDEDVAPPRGGRARVGDAREGADGPGARGADGPAPQPEGGAERRHGDGLVVVAPGHRAHDVRRDDGHEERRRHAGT
mmetsp:Transcript_44720/g.126520  ORF Transcript_44720/g.126520 Transcript_44720/m.126520 type:complete len:216 (-) Transcript_44720:301-948(-)